MRIWDTTQPDNVLKITTKVFSGRVNDIDWDSESKRLIAVGEGKDRFGHAFLVDTASTVGEIGGHSKVINSVAIRPCRPLRAATASDDTTVNWHHGVPFKFNKSLDCHSRFALCVRFSPDGALLASSGADGKLFLYDGQTGGLVTELTDAHTGGIYSLSWSPDGKSLLTVSADRCAKLWDITSKSVLSSHSFTSSDNPIDDQQVGSLWVGNHLLSLSLSGDINYLDPRSSNPSRTIRSHSKGITALAIDASQTLFSGSYDGRVCRWSDGFASVVSGPGHTNQVVSISADTNKVLTAAMDDSIRVIDKASQSFTNQVVATGSVPKSLAGRNDVAVSVTNDHEAIIVVNGAKQVSIKLPYAPSAVALSPNGVTVAIGAVDSKVYIYDLHSNSSLDLKTQLSSNKGPITSLAYSPKGDLLASADAQRTIVVFETTDYQLKIHQWVFHNARVNSIAWSPDGLHAVSSSLDTNVEVWSVETPMKHISIKAAHQDSATGAVFIDNGTIASAGQDAQIKLWSLKHF